MTTPHDPRPDAADADDELPMPLTLAPMLTLDANLLDVAYQYYLADLDGAHDSATLSTKLRGKLDHAYAALTTVAWQITEAGALDLTGSDGTTCYRVDTSCCQIKGRSKRNSKTGKHSAVLCPDWTFNGQQCYHRIAFELLRIVQAMQLPDDA